MINIIAVLSVLTLVFVIVALRSSSKPKPNIVPCKCGKTQDNDGYCDGSHTNIEDKKVV